MEIQGATSSSSSSNDVNQKVEMSEEVKEGEPENKKVKQDELTNPEETQNETTINDLPAEMLMKIFSLVDDKTLVACRLINRAWRDISTDILCSRGEIELQFTFDETNKIFKQWIKNKMVERSLGDFLECFNESKNCFYTRFLFRFKLDPPSKFENEDWLEFFSYIEDYIKCLRLVIEPTGSSSIEDVSKDLSDLLLKKLPQLEEFGLIYSSEGINGSEIQLFPSEKVAESTTETTNTTTTETETIETTFTTRTKTKTRLPVVQLTHLKVLHLSELLFSSCPRIVDDLLKAAVNLKKIQDFAQHHYRDWTMFLQAKSYVVLHSHGKLDLLKEAQMTPSVELFSACKRIVHAFKLKKLQLQMQSVYTEEGNWEDASTFISCLFESSKDTLTELTMDPIGFLPDVKFPRFTKLKMLSIKDTDIGEIFPLFPSGINSLDVFPALRTLDLDVNWTKSFPGVDNIPRIPSVETLRVMDWKITESSIVKMSLMCPNLKGFRIHIVYDEDSIFNFPEVGREIWTNMRQLESLEFQIHVDFEFNAFHSLDSCFTGISKDHCKRLYQLTKAEEYLKRWNSQLNIPKSEFETPERESVSILDLKDLKNLDIKVDWYLGNRTTDDALNTALTCVSEVCAFKLMKNLNYKIDQQFQY